MEYERIEKVQVWHLAALLPSLFSSPLPFNLIVVVFFIKIKSLFCFLNWVGGKMVHMIQRFLFLEFRLNFVTPPSVFYFLWAWFHWFPPSEFLTWFQKACFCFFYFCNEWKDGACHYYFLGGWVRKRGGKRLKIERKKKKFSHFYRGRTC